MDEMNEMDDSDLDAEAQDTDEAGEETAAGHERASQTARKLEPVVLAHVLGPKYQPVKPRVIARQLDLPSEQHKALKLAIRRLVKDGKLAYGKGHQVRRPSVPDTNPKRQRGTEEARRAGSPSYEGGDGARTVPATPKKGEILGTFRRASGGYGFVRPTGVKRGSDKSQDIFIPATRSKDAADGDIVRVRIGSGQGRSRRGEMRQAGEILEVVERETNQFVGTYKERGGEAVVEIDGRTFATPISVGDPGAKGAAPGDKVVIEMVRFPSPMHPGEAVITEVLGAKGQPGVDTLSIIKEFGLPEEFPDDVLEAARQEAEAFDESIGTRLDLTGETIITIDPVDARDFDDAISLSRPKNGHWKLGVHIADVSHFVKPRTPLDREARERATSVYLPDRVLPMLPEVISNNLASLQPNKVRYTQTAFIEFTADGAPVAGDFHLSAIKSCRRFAYEEVDEFLSDRKAWKQKLTPQVHELLSHMHELAMILRQRRMKNGAIELTLPEVKVDLDKQGQVSGAHLVKNTESHQIIEEFMLAANEAVARHLHEREIHLLRRIHELPDPRKLHLLTGFIRELGIECESLESRFEIKRVVKLVAGQPEEHAVNYAILRSMQKAVYSPLEEGHYALNSEQYCHFTSPIRRYPDLTVHRLLTALAQHKKPKSNFDELVVLGEHCSERELRAQIAERELTKVKLLTYLSQKIGMEMDAVITGVEEFGIFAQGIELPAEGLIHVETLDDDQYRYDSATHSLAGYREGNRYRLGDVIRVTVGHVDVDRRELDFRLAGRLAKSPKTGKRLQTPIRAKDAQPADRRPRRDQRTGQRAESRLRSSRNDAPRAGASRGKAGGTKRGGNRRKGKR
jgi:ribonuclease R